jgi:hypothetical protein
MSEFRFAAHPSRRPGEPSERSAEAAETWSGRLGVFGYPGALGCYLAGTGR